MAEGITPVTAPIWDRRTISSIRRELEKGFEALKISYERANKEQTEDARKEATKRAVQFYDLYEARMACKIENSKGAEESANQLVTDFGKYKEVLERHYTTDTFLIRETVIIIKSQPSTLNLLFRILHTFALVFRIFLL